MEFKPFKIGKYLLLERIATGGMAEVYRAKASGAGGFEKQLAIKRILPTYSTNDEFRRMFEYEARLSSMLTHANIVQIYDFVKSGETYLLAMEYVGGKNLRQFINKAKKMNYTPPVEFGVYAINEVCKGLEYAHKKKDDVTGTPLNIIHRDMSPQNIMLSYEGAVKIVDFGIAKAKDRVDETRSGVIKGKFGYMSPEQANAEPVDHRTDIFSTGIILFEMLTGRRLFAADSDIATLKLIQECVIPQPSRINPKITPELEKIMLKGLAKDLTLRYRTAGAFHQALQEFMSKNYTSFSQKDMADILQSVFSDEIEREKKRFEQIYRQSIPFSQGEQKEPEGAPEDVENLLDGDTTKSEVGLKTAVTFIEEDGNDDKQQEELLSEDFSLSSPAEDFSINDEEQSKSTEDTQVEEIVPEEEAQRESTDPKTGLRVPEKKEQTAKTVAKGKTAERSAPKSNRVLEPLEDTEAPPPGSPTEPSYEPTAITGKKTARIKTDSEVLLHDSSSTLRRRDRSISVLKEVSENQDSQPNYLLGSLPESTHIRMEQPTTSKSAERPQLLEERGSRDRGLKRFVSFSLFLCVLASTVYLYRIYLGGHLPTVIAVVNERQISKNPEASKKFTEESNQAPVKKPGGDCVLEIDTDPSGAMVKINGQDRSRTPTTALVACNRAIDVTLVREGYETISENLVPKEKAKKVYKTLKKIPMGTLELRLSQNAKVYIEDTFFREVRANEPFEIPLRANKRFKIRFRNEVYRIDTVREFYIQEDSILRKTVQLDPVSSKPLR